LPVVFASNEWKQPHGHGHLGFASMELDIVKWD